jgi:hypothetical protein
MILNFPDEQEEEQEWRQFENKVIGELLPRQLEIKARLDGGRLPINTLLALQQETFAGLALLHAGLPPHEAEKFVRNIAARLGPEWLALRRRNKARADRALAELSDEKVSSIYWGANEQTRGSICEGVALVWQSGHRLWAPRRGADCLERVAMSQYRFLQDHYVNGVYYQAGTIASTFDVGGSLPTGWQPSGAVDPLDEAAVTAFYAMGPQIRASVGIAIARPVTYWTPNPNPTLPGNAGREFVLTGLGAGLPFVQLLGTRGVYPWARMLFLHW